MSLFGKSSNPEPIGKTEPLNSWSYADSVGQVGVTEPVDMAGLIEIDPTNKDDKNTPIIDPIGHTVPVNLIPVNNDSSTVSSIQPVVGWLVCIEGPDFGHVFQIHSDYNYLGRVEGDIIVSCDQKISARNHMRISYEQKRRIFSVGTFEGRNFIYVNDDPLEGTVRLKDYDIISTGDTKLLFRSLCGERFSWVPNAK